MLTDKEKVRYSRHILLNDFGESAQEKLKKAKVLCIGAGGLGSPLLMYLASSGIGRVGVMDFDRVSLDNLQRQIIHNEAAIDSYKTDSSKIFLNNLNSLVEIKTYNASALDKEAERIINEYDIIAVCVDEIKSRYKINELSFKYKKPQIVGGIVAYSGFITYFNPNIASSPCYQCLQPKEDNYIIKKAKDIGVFAPLVGVIGCYMAQEVIREVIGFKNPLLGKVKQISMLDNTESIFKLNQDKNCKHHN